MPDAFLDKNILIQEYRWEESSIYGSKLSWVHAQGSY